MNEQPKRVLFLFGMPVGIGGIETAIMEVFRGIDRSKLLIDFAVRKPDKGFFHDEIESHGGRIINVFANTKHKGNKKWNVWMDIQYIYNLYKLLKKNGPYCAVHIAQPIFEGFAIIAARLAGVPVRIVHSHMTGSYESMKPNWFRRLMRKWRIYFCRKWATHIWGCSAAAAKYLFGKNILEDDRAEIVPNPINLRKFMNDRMNKEEACKKLNINPEKMNLIHVGRYVPEKNQMFLLEVLCELIKKNMDVHLTLIGSGPLEQDLKRRIRELGIQEYVTMLDSSVSVPTALAASDCLLFPSLCEGFGNVLLEAQAAGIPCFASDVCQPEANVGLVEYIPLEKGAKYWAEHIVSSLGNMGGKSADLERLMQYDTPNVAPRMQKVYLEGKKYSETAI